MGYLGTLFSGATYNPLGGMTGWTFGNGWQETSTFTKRGLLQSRTDTKGTAYPQFTLGFAPNGNVLSANDKFNGNWTYTYDDFNRLAGANQNTGQTVYNYKYDRYSNRWQQNLTAGSGQTSNLSFSGNNNRIDGSSYDAAGNLLNDGRHSYTYDAENRITQVDAGATASYVYNANGLRVRKTVSGTSTDYLFDLDGRQIQQFDGATGANLGGEVYANGRHVAAYANSTMYFIHPDWLGTERARTDISAAIHDSCVNLAYGDGQTCTTVGGDPSPLHFTGEPRDSETSLDWMQARHYSSQYGRFMTPDPAGIDAADLTNPQSLNQYAYVTNNPVNMTDPSGMDLCDDFAPCDDGGLGGIGSDCIWCEQEPGLGGGGIGGGGIFGGLPGLGGGLPGISLPGGDGCDFVACGYSGSGDACDLGMCEDFRGVHHQHSRRNIPDVDGASWGWRNVLWGLATYAVDWRNYVPRHGNWCGPNYSGGESPSVTGHDGPLGPTDALDAGCQQHDYVYGATEDEQARRQADIDLLNTAKGLPDDPSYNLYRRALIRAFTIRTR
jgi:RHS repeat-associated protein